MGERAQKEQAEALKKTLKKFGYKDEAQQNAIIDYVNERNKARLNLEVATQRLARAVANKKATDAEISEALARLRQTVTSERIRRAQTREDRLQAELKLDEKIGFSKSPRLEAVLTMMGVIGDETEMLAVSAPGFESEATRSQQSNGPGGQGGERGGRGGGGSFPGGGGGFPGGGFPGGF